MLHWNLYKRIHRFLWPPFLIILKSKKVKLNVCSTLFLIPLVCYDQERNQLLFYINHPTHVYFVNLTIGTTKNVFVCRSFAESGSIVCRITEYQDENMLQEHLPNRKRYRLGQFLFEYCFWLVEAPFYYVISLRYSILY